MLSVQRLITEADRRRVSAGMRKEAMIVVRVVELSVTVVIPIAPMDEKKSALEVPVVVVEDMKKGEICGGREGMREEFHQSVVDPEMTGSTEGPHLHLEVVKDPEKDIVVVEKPPTLKVQAMSVAVV